MTNNWGGVRRKAGRKRIVQGEVAKPRSLTLDNMTVRKLRVVGGGNVSQGARIAADLAYEKLQREE